MPLSERRLYVALWGYLLGVDLTEELRTAGRPVDEPVRYLFEDQRQFRTTRVERPQLAAPGRCAPRPRAAPLRGGRRPCDRGAATRFCPWNEGRFALTVDGSGAGRRRARAGPLPISSSAAEVLGSRLLGRCLFSCPGRSGPDRGMHRRSGGLSGRACSDAAAAAILHDAFLTSDPVRVRACSSSTSLGLRRNVS